MGWWNSEHGTIGDTAADALTEALCKIEDEYLEFAGRPPSQGELADLIEFCTCGCLKPICGSATWPFSKSTAVDAETPRAVEQGGQGCLVCKPPRGKLANIDPATGEHYDAPTET